MQFTDQTQGFNYHSSINNILFSKPMNFDDWYDVVKPDIEKIDAWEQYQDYRHRNVQARLRNIDIQVSESSNHNYPIPDRIFLTKPTGKICEELVNSYIVEDNAWYAKELSYIRRFHYQKAFSSYLETVMPAIILAGITFWNNPNTSFCYKMYVVDYAGKRAVDPKPNQEIEIVYVPSENKKTSILDKTTKADKRLNQIKVQTQKLASLQG